ncbi:16369_t:CDS:2 [Dentiscutata heterogama]|uniref:16369_t:CDS:1 n=1 Tax=Dentiscutata heterogama TaxID=1316150 RepID=A0ACA9KHB2_9GLOM|nr:16369_t:CDS:2 [Dentiscutata heterogama]
MVECSWKANRLYSSKAAIGLIRNVGLKVNIWSVFHEFSYDSNSAVADTIVKKFVV